MGRSDPNRAAHLPPRPDLPSAARGTQHAQHTQHTQRPHPSLPGYLSQGCSGHTASHCTSAHCGSQCSSQDDAGCHSNGRGAAAASARGDSQSQSQSQSQQQQQQHQCQCQCQQAYQQNALRHPGCRSLGSREHTRMSLLASRRLAPDLSHITPPANKTFACGDLRAGLYSPTDATLSPLSQVQAKGSILEELFRRKVEPSRLGAKDKL